MGYQILNQEYLDKMGIDGTIIENKENKIPIKMDKIKDVIKTDKIYNLEEFEAIIKDKNLDLISKLGQYKLSIFYKINTEVMRKYKDILIWDKVQYKNTLTEEQILEFWNYVSIQHELVQNPTITIKFIEKYCLKDEYTYKFLNLRRHDITDEWIYKNRKLLNYGSNTLNLFPYDKTQNESRQLPEYILNAIAEDEDEYNTSLEEITQCQALTEEFVEKYKNEIDFAIMFDYNCIIEYSDEFKMKYIDEYNRDRNKLNKIMFDCRLNREEN